jgi:hypothetical protein
LVSALRSGRRGRAFESPHPDFKGLALGKLSGKPEERERAPLRLVVVVSQGAGEVPRIFNGM